MYVKDYGLFFFSPIISFALTCFCILQFTTVYYSFQVTAQQAIIRNTICVMGNLLQFTSWNASDNIVLTCLSSV